MTIRHSLLSFTLLTGTLSAQISTPWLPSAGALNISVTYVNDSFQNVRLGANKGRLPASFDQISVLPSIEYGLHKRLAFDLVTGYSKVTLGAQSAEGSVDTLVGLRYIAWQGERFTFTLRGAGIIAGSYPLVALRPSFAPGFKASGFSGSTLFGFSLNRGVFVSTQTGYNVFESPVAHQFFGNTVVGQSIRRLTYFAGYQTNRSVSGPDIFGAGFTPSRFPEIKKIYGGLDVGASYTIGKHMYAGINYGRFLHGRNAGQKQALALTLGFEVPKRGPHF